MNPTSHQPTRVSPAIAASGLASDREDSSVGQNSSAIRWIAILCVLTALLAGIVLAARHIILVDLGWSGVQSSVAGSQSTTLSPQPTAPTHPLEAALQFARQVQKNIDENVHDYTATLFKQERIGNALPEPEICQVKIRNKPFSVYMKFLAPPDKAGQEVVFVEGQNDGKLIGHAGSGIAAKLGSLPLPPNGPIAMLGQHYPITELGISNLTRRLIEVGEKDIRFGDCDVWRDENASVNGRPCILLTVMHPEKQKEFIFHIARIFIDKELMVPLRYEAYDWPAKPGETPQLIESYTYANLKLNPGLTDADFDPKNPEYNFGMK